MKPWSRNGRELPYAVKSIWAAMLVCLAVGSCSTRGAIVYTPHADSKVVNGIAHESGTFSLEGRQVLHVPPGTLVRRGADGGDCTLHIRKVLGYFGHPHERYTIDQERKEMGCALALREDGAWLGTFGEFETPQEGGKTVHLCVTVPTTVEVIESGDLGRFASLANCDQLRSGRGTATSHDLVWRSVATELCPPAADWDSQPGE